MRRYLPLLFIALVLLIVPLGVSGAARDTVRSAIAPVSHSILAKQIAVSNWFRSIQQISGLRAEKEELQARNLQLQQRLSEEENVKRENEALRKELGAQGISRSIPKVLARIILQGSDPLERSVTIDIGTEQGVRVGQPAISEGALVGRVTAAQRSTATVRFINSRSSLVQAWIGGSREKGLLVGEGNAVFLSDITQGVTVQAGDIVETSGLGDSLPAGLPVGTIRESISKPSDPSQRFTVVPLRDLASLESVFILLTEPPQ